MITQQKMDTCLEWTGAFWTMASRLRHLGILCDVTLSVGTDPKDVKIFQVGKAFDRLFICSFAIFLQIRSP